MGPTRPKAADPTDCGQCPLPPRQVGAAWLARPECRIKLHFVPAYWPHLDPTERLWGLMHRHVTHNRCHQTFADFKAAVLNSLREKVPRKWATYCEQVTDDFRIISPQDLRVLA